MVVVMIMLVAFGVDRVLCMAWCRRVARHGTGLLTKREYVALTFSPACPMFLPSVQID